MAAAQRRPTARSLLRQVLKQPGCELRYSNVRVVPVGARPVLEAVVALVANSEDGRTYECDAELDEGGLATWVALHMRAVGAEPEIGSHLAALARARLIILAGNTVSLPLPTAANDGGERVGTSPGRPRKDETDEQWEERKRLNRVRLDEQRRRDAGEAGQAQLGNGLHVFKGGRDDGNTASNIPGYISTDISSGNRQAEIRMVSQAASTDIPADIPTSPVAAAASASNISITEAAAAAGKPAREAADISPGHISKSSGDISAEADTLAGELVRELDLRPSAIEGVIGVVRGWLRAPGATPELLREVFREGYDYHRQQRGQGLKGISSANWFTKRVQARLEHRRIEALPPGAATSGASSPPGSALPPDPRLDRWPHVAAAPRLQHKRALDMLETLATQAADRQRQALSVLRDYFRPEFDLVGVLHPEIYELFSEEQPARRAGAA